MQKPFIPGNGSMKSLPLSRFLPPLEEGMVSNWLKGLNLPPGSWVLDPFGSHPSVVLEAARSGLRVLVASNNPILTFLLEMLASAPAQSEYTAALAALEASRRGEERLERHLQSLYQTECAVCGQGIQAQAFLWQRDSARPFARLYRCPSCGDEGERPVTQADLERLNLIGSDGLHRSRALARVTTDTSSEQREIVEEALRTYPPRPLYVLTTLINKIDSLGLTPDRKNCLTALMISLCDEGNTLWPYPSTRPRPRQLTVPTQFRENNLWVALENAAATWINPLGSVPLVHWPEQPPESGGVCLYPGRLKSLLPLPAELKPRALLTMVPRPNQAFWTLCALWSGWIWGREAVQPLKFALERRRYDWHWMAHALYSALSGPSQKLAQDTLFLAGASELTPGFLLALHTAPFTAGFGLNGLSFNSEEDCAQFWWCSGKPAAKPARQSPKTICQQAVQHHLAQRGEPAPYLALYTAYLTNLAAHGLLPQKMEEITPDLFSRIQATLSEVLENSNFAVRYPGHTQAEEGGLWWLANSSGVEQPLADRLEREVVSALLQREEIDIVDLKREFYDRFPGYLTPSTSLIETCLNSYAEEIPGKPGFWRLRPQEQPAARRMNLAEAKDLISKAAERLGYRFQDGEPLQWLKPNGQVAYQFYLMASAIISRSVFEQQSIPLRRCVLVLPGSRASLLSLKLERDPRLNEAVENGWRILKFRLLRELAAHPNLSLDLWEDLLDGDPPRWEEATQMRMF